MTRHQVREEGTALALHFPKPGATRVDEGLQPLEDSFQEIMKDHTADAVQVSMTRMVDLLKVTHAQTARLNLDLPEDSTEGAVQVNEE